MAVVITPSNSRTTSYFNDLAGLVFLITEGGYVISDGSDHQAVVQLTGGHVSATINGSVIGNGNLAVGGVRVGIAAGPDQNGHNSVIVSSSGTVQGYDGVLAFAGNNAIVNDGTIQATGFQGGGVLLSGGGNRLVNNGLVSGFYGVNLSGDGDTILNTGMIAGDSGVAMFLIGSGTAIENRGTISGVIDATNASFISLLNDGAITGVAVFDNNWAVENYGIMQGLTGNGAGRIINHGTIGDVFESSAGSLVNLEGAHIRAYLAGDAADPVSGSIENAGRIDHAVLGGGDDMVDNAGVIGELELREGANALTNTGEITTALFGDGGDTLTNSGTISGTVTLGAGDDIVDTADGRIIGRVDLGDGHDTYAGGAGADRVIGGAGDDVIDLGAGDDVFRAGIKDGNDAIDGGDGNDTYSAGGVTQAVLVDLSAGVAAKGAGQDTLTGFENVVGGKGGDTLIGDDGRNRIGGGAGADALAGGDGADRLNGGADADRLTGGAGRDVMTGGETGGGGNASDVFVFAGGDSGATAATRDIVTDFTDHGSAAPPFAKGADTIDLSAIDANTGAGGNQAFTFNATEGADFSGVAGSLVWQQRDGFALVLGDVNGDRVADFAIQLNGTHMLFASDFVL